jgi:hypothetical protein
MEMFLECGWSAWVTLLLGLVSLVVTGVALGLALMRNRFALALSFLALAIALSPAAAGVAGTYMGRNMVERALVGVTPEQRERILAVGYAEAAQCTRLGLGFGALPMALGFAGIGVALVRRKTRSG